MVTLRHYVISIAAIFFALALGIVLGSGFLGKELGSKGGSDHALAAVKEERARLETKVSNADAFMNAIAPRATRGALKDQRVVVFSTPDAASADISRVITRITTAGGRVVGQLGMTNALVSEHSTTQLQAIVDQSIPAGVTIDPKLQSTARVGSLLGQMLLLNPKTSAPQSKPSDLATTINALKDGNFLQFSKASAIEPGTVALLITGGNLPNNSGNRAGSVAQFVSALASRGNGAVVMGRDGAASPLSVVGQLRTQPSLTEKVSTVDDGNEAAGQISSVLALADATKGSFGAYGIGDGAKAPSPN